MRLDSKKVLIYMFISVFSFIGCVDEKDLYDPDFRTPNPVEEFTVPDGFDWKTLISIDVEVRVADKFNNAFSYLIELFVTNPVSDNDAKAFTAGYAKGNYPFNSLVTVPKSVKYIYIRQTTPDGLTSVRSFEMDGKKIVCDFSKSTPATGTRAVMTRAGWNITEPSLPGMNKEEIFPTTIPADAVDFENRWTAGTANEWKKIKISDHVALTSSNAGQYVEYYITGKVVVSANAMSYRKYYIMPGAEVTFPGGYDASQTDVFMSIGKGAIVKIQGQVKLTRTNHFYNLGTVNTASVHTVGEAYIYNEGSISVDGLTDLEYNFYNVGGSLITAQLKIDQAKVETFYNTGQLKITQGSGDALDTGNNVLIYNTHTIEVSGDWKLTKNANIVNKADITVSGSIKMNDGENKFLNDIDGEINCSGFSSTGSAGTMNYGVVQVNGNTNIRSKDEWTNKGKWITETMETISYGADYLNECYLEVKDKLSFRQARFTNAKGSFIKTKDLHIENSRIEMYDESYLNATGISFAKGSRQLENEGVYGMGSETRSLLRMAKLTVDGADSQHLYLSGNLQVACDNYPAQYANGQNAVWVIANGAEWATYDTNTVSIPESECNDGWNPGTVPPVDPPIDPVVDPFTYTYLFEDMWPLYGDYDMNDVVLRVKNITSYIDKDNKVNKYTLDVTLCAVGAEKRIAGAFMLDNIQQSEVKSVSYSAQQPRTFDVSSAGVENNQTKAVIPLFDEAHSHLGKPSAWYINTNATSPDNVPEPTVITITLDFSTPVDVTNLNVAYLNMFIITDIDKGRPVTNNSRREIHLVDYRPTQMAETDVFGKNNDDSSLSGNRYYISKENLPWGIVIPDTFKWPVEHMKIQKAYGGFEEWVTSGGTGNKEWYKYPVSSDVVYSID